MDPIRVAPSTQGSHTARQKSGSESAQTPGAFLALLSGLGAQALDDGDAPLSKDALAADPGALDRADTSGLLFADGSSYALPVEPAGDVAGDTTVSASLQGVASDAVSAMAARGSGPQGADAGVEVGVKTGAGGTTKREHALPPRLDGRSQGAGASPTGSQVPLAAGIDGMLAPEGRLVPGSLASASLVAQTARMDAANAAPTDGVAVLQVPSSSSARRATNSALLTKTQPLAQALNAAGKPASLAQVAGVAALSTPKDMQAALANPSMQADLHKPTEAGRSGAHDALGLTGASPLPISAGAWAGDLNRERSQQPANERTGFGSAPIGQALGDSTASPAMEAGVGTADGAAPSPEEAVAEQVTYWLSENLKNAELTVEHAGQPVEVRVSLVGNEAHVAFRSDQAQTRELLGARLEQLRELLQDQGLVLSGATVDTGASGQSGDRDDKSTPESARTAGVQHATEVPARVIRRILTSSSVDLYV